MEKNKKTTAGDIVVFCRRLYERGFVAGTEGNLSVRLNDGNIMITPAGMNKGYLKPDDLVVCTPDGEKIEGKNEPSSEIILHLAVYGHRSDVNAVCHSHPPYATACSLAGESFNKAILPEFLVTFGAVPLVKYATPGTRGLSQNIEKNIDRYDAFLLEAHGILALGGTLVEAFNRTEMLEQYARILFISRQIKEPDLIPRSETDRLLNTGGRQVLADEIIAGDDSEL